MFDVDPFIFGHFFFLLVIKLFLKVLLLLFAFLLCLLHQVILNLLALLVVVGLDSGFVHATLVGVLELTLQHDYHLRHAA